MIVLVILLGVLIFAASVAIFSGALMLLAGNLYALEVLPQPWSFWESVAIALLLSTIVASLRAGTKVDISSSS